MKKVHATSAEIAQDSRFPMPINREMTDKECLHCGSKIERGAGGLWYSAATGSTCYENRAGGGHNPIPDATPSVDARPIIVNGDYVYGTGSPIAEPAKPSWERPHKFEPKNWQGREMPACEICGRLSDAVIHTAPQTVIDDAPMVEQKRTCSNCQNGRHAYCAGNCFCDHKKCGACGLIGNHIRGCPKPTPTVIPDAKDEKETVLMDEPRKPFDFDKFIEDGISSMAPEQLKRFRQKTEDIIAMSETIQ